MEYFALVEEIEGMYLVSFPDFLNILTYGETLKEALSNGNDALNVALEADFERSYSLPIPKDYSGRKGFYSIPLLPHVALAYQLRMLRKETQVALAKKLGVTYQAYQKLENPRKCNPTVKTLERLGDLMGRKLVISFR